MVLILLFFGEYRWWQAIQTALGSFWSCCLGRIATLDRTALPCQVVARYLHTQGHPKPQDVDKLFPLTHNDISCMFAPPKGEFLSVIPTIISSKVLGFTK